MQAVVQLRKSVSVLIGTPYYPVNQHLLIAGFIVQSDCKTVLLLPGLDGMLVHWSIIPKFVLGFPDVG